LTTAADELCVTQPALSKSLKRLEEELGVPLFQRTPAGMVPTTYGVALGRRARQIHLESMGARSELELMREGGYGSVVIGIGPMLSVHAFPHVVADLIRSQPKTHIRIISGVLDTLLPRLLKGELDVVIASLDFPDHPDLIKEHLFDTEHVIVAREGHPLAARQDVTPTELLDFPFAGYADDYAGVSRMDKFFASHGIQSPGLSVECSSLELLLSLLSAGDFLASVSKPILHQKEKKLGICRIQTPESFWRYAVGAIHRRGREHAKVITSMLQLMRAAVDG
jgi:DNA-binding transcriptional LysR family regulator